MRQRTHFPCSGSVLVSYFFFFFEGENVRGSVLWADLSTQNACFEVPPGSQQVTIFRGRVFKEVVKLNEAIKVGPDPVSASGTVKK